MSAPFLTLSGPAPGFACSKPSLTIHLLLRYKQPIGGNTEKEKRTDWPQFPKTNHKQKGIPQLDASDVSSSEFTPQKPRGSPKRRGTLADGMKEPQSEGIREDGTLAALKISSDFCTVYAFSPFSRDIAARTTDSRARRPFEALLGAAGRVEIPDATAAAAAPAILCWACLSGSREVGGGADEGG